MVGRHWQQTNIIRDSIDFLVIEPEGDMLHYRIMDMRLGRLSNLIGYKNNKVLDTWKEVLEAIEGYLKDHNREDDWNILQKKLMEEVEPFWR